MDLPQLCERCGEPLGVLNTKIEGEFRIRFYGCRECGWRPKQNKQIVPLQYAPRRRRRLNRRRLNRR